MQADAQALAHLLAAVEAEILPRTREGVSVGNKIFGAALLAKADGRVVCAGTNDEINNPLWHGEVHTLKLFYEMPRDLRPPVSDLVFLSTHEPCPMCLSAITWAGFDTIFYLFSHEESRDTFAIPHDLRILSEVFGLQPGGYRRQNAFWTARAMPELAAALPDSERQIGERRIAAIRARYAELSEAYQRGKSRNDIPLA